MAYFQFFSVEAQEKINITSIKDLIKVYKLTIF